MVQFICGIERRDGGVPNTRLLHAMFDAMNPLRKPEVRDFAVDGRVALGVIALAPCAGATPEPARVMRLPDGLMVADARLYGEPTGTLEGAIAAERLAAVRRLGGWRGLAPLHGDFAYAWWERANGMLELGRDHFGVRPVVYTQTPGEYVAFASHPAALLGTGLVGREIDGPAMVHVMRDYYPHADHTVYAAMRAVRAAHVVRFAPGLQADPQCYWRLPIPRRRPLGSKSRGTRRGCPATPGAGRAAAAAFGRARRGRGQRRSRTQLLSLSSPRAASPKAGGNSSATASRMTERPGACRRSMSFRPPGKRRPGCRT